MSLQPIVSSMLIDFEQSNFTAEQKAYQKQVYSTIKMNLSDMQSYEVIDKFTQCTKCKHILTDKDKGHVFDFQQVDSNPGDFKKQSVQQLRQNRFTKVLWICGFCNYDNIVNNVDIRFTKNRTRVIQREKMNQKRDPIMLIVFDVSGSMQELIQDTTGKTANWPHLDKIKQTKIYKKIVLQQQKELQQLIKSQHNGTVPKQSKYKYIDYLKKNKLLMGLTQYLITKLNPQKKGNDNKQRTNQKINDFCSSNDASKNKKLPGSKNKTIGFMFFNSNLAMCLDNVQGKAKKVLLVDTHEEYKPKFQGYETKTVDFDSFQALYKAGQDYGGDYTAKLSNFQFDNLDFKSIASYTQGQTALGPALVAALGVVSKHGQGSSIVIVTDGIGNKGIFDQTQPWQQSYKLMKMRLEKLKCFMTILEFRKLIDKNKMKQEEFITGLDRFCQRHNDSVVKKINVLLNEADSKGNSNSNGATTLQDIEKKMKTGIDRQNCIFSNDVIIRCQHPHVNYSKAQDQFKSKLFNLKQTIHVTPQFKQTSLVGKDFLHHFMTQIVIRYENTQTGEQCTFMSYIIQKFIKYTKMRPKDLKSLDNVGTFLNVIEYLHNEQEQLNLDNLPLGLIRETFRKTLSMSAIAQKTLRFPSKYANQGDISYEWMQNMKKYEDQAAIKEQQKLKNNKNNKNNSKNVTKINSTFNQPVKKIQTKSESTKSIFGAKVETSQQKEKFIIKQERIQQHFVIEQQDSDDQYMKL